MDDLSAEALLGLVIKTALVVLGQEPVRHEVHLHLPGDNGGRRVTVEILSARAPGAAAMLNLLARASGLDKRTREGTQPSDASLLPSSVSDLKEGDVLAVMEAARARRGQ